MSKNKKSKINWHRTWKNNVYMLGLIYKACPGILVVTFLSSVFGALHSFLLNAYLFQYALNALQAGEALQRILLTVGCLFGFSVLYMVYGCFSKYYIELRTPRVEAYIQNLLQKKAVEVELACFERPAFYNTYVKAVGEASNRAFTVMNNFSNVIWIVLNVFAVGALIVTIDPIFLVFAFLPLICTLLLGKRRNRLRYDYNMKNKEAGRKKDYVRRVFYLKDFSKEMRLTEMWRVMLRRMHESVSEMKAYVSEYGYTLMWLAYLFDFVFDIVVYSGSILLAAFQTLVTKTMLLGDCFVVINSITNIASNINYAGDVFLKLDENSLYIDNLRAFLDYNVQIAEDESAPLAPKMEKLEFCKVSFWYEGQKSPALQSVDLCISKGEKIAIVGHNGAGKSTLIKLLLRLYDPTEGEILLNGVDVRQLRLSSYRALYGSVFQDYRLFATGVAENVHLRGSLTEQDERSAEDALKKSGMLEKIQSLPQGVCNAVTKEFDPNGAVFSGGEAQKIAIARIFAGEQEIVILDEPTSALDPIAEQEMYQNMFEACKGKTVIFISHRLSSATAADRIYVFENGQVLEQGTHSELLKQNGLYTEMWHKQADTYTADAGTKAVTE